MKKMLLIVFILLLGSATVWANPMASVQGVVSYSESISVYFDSEANATRWVQTQTDFMSQRESNAAVRRIMEGAMETIMPDLSDMARMESDFFVMITRSQEKGESSLMLFVNGVLTRLWQY